MQTVLDISSQHGHSDLVKKLLTLDITVDCVDDVSYIASYVNNRLAS